MCIRDSLDVADAFATYRGDPSRYGSVEALMREGVPRDGFADAMRDVTRALTVTQSVLNLTTSLLRSSPGTMPGLLNALGDGGEGAAAVKEWKPGGLINAVSYAHRNVEILAAILAEGQGARSDQLKRVENQLVKDGDDDACAQIIQAVTTATRALERECASFRATYNYFCSSLVKNVANARHRASVETVAFLRVPIAELSACLSENVKDAVDCVDGALTFSFRDGTDAGALSPGIARRRLCGLFETLHAILIDERRRCSQGLVLNYMDQCLGVQHLRRAFEILWSVAADEAAGRDKGNVDKGKEPAEPAGAGVTLPAPLSAHVAAALRSATSLLLQLVDVDVLFGSSGSAANVVAPRGFVPENAGTPGYPPPSDPRVFAARLHANLAPAVLAAWRSKALTAFPGEAASHLMSALVHFGKGTEKLPERVAHYLDLSLIHI